MPSAKPDKDEIQSLLRERGYSDRPEESFIDVLGRQCRAVAGEGFITPAGAADLLSWLNEQPEIAAVFPHSVLKGALETMLCPDGWSSEAEEAILRFIACFYFEADFFSALIYLSDMFAKHHFLFGDLYERIFDVMDQPPGLEKTFVCFTGPFKSGTRAQCFERARALGSVPAEYGGQLDYTFVADEAALRHSFSNKVIGALAIRAKYGHMKLFREGDWDRCIAGLPKQ